MKGVCLTFIALFIAISTGETKQNNFKDVPPQPIPSSSEKPSSTTATTTTNITTTTKPLTTTKPISTLIPDNHKTTTAIPTTGPITTTVKPITSTTVKPTEKPAVITTALPTSEPISDKGRHFDGLSFMGGIIMTICVTGIGLLSWKFYKVRTERSYHTL